MNDKIRTQFWNDPLYGPNGPFFWPGTQSEAYEFAHSCNCISTEDFLEEYEDPYSGVECYIANTEHPSEEFVDEMYAHFYKVYDGIQSWPAHTFFVSALYRTVFSDIFPYQSKRYDVTKCNRADDLEPAYLSKGLYDEAIRDQFLQSLEKTQQEKEIDKVGGRISYRTWSLLIRSLRHTDLDPLACQEVVRVVKQYRLVEAYPEDFKEPLLFRFKSVSSSGRKPPDTKEFTDGLLVCLSLLPIPIERSQQAIKRSLAEKSYAPLIDFLQAKDGSGVSH